MESTPPAEPYPAGPDDVVVLEAGRRSRRYLREVWDHRRVLTHLVWRDLRVRYAQTAIGLAWGLLRPLLSMGVYTLVFSTLAGLPGQGETPYALVVLSALLPWQLFSSGLLHASQALVLNRGLVTRTWFPRVILPAAAVVNGVVDFFAAWLVLSVLLLATATPLSPTFLLVPLFGLLALMPAFGLGLWLSAVNIRYRDFAYLVPFLLQLGQFLSPVGFVSWIVPAPHRDLYGLNPLVAAIDGVRWCLIPGSPSPRLFDLVAAVGLSLLLIGSGLWFFRRREGTFADHI